MKNNRLYLGLTSKIWKSINMTIRLKLRNQVNQIRNSVTVEQFHEYAFGFFLWKHLSQLMKSCGDEFLAAGNSGFANFDKIPDRDIMVLSGIKKYALKRIGFYILPSELFETVATQGLQPGAVFLADLTDILIEMNTPSGQKPDTLFLDVELDMVNMQKTIKALIPELLDHLGMIASRMGTSDK